MNDLDFTPQKGISDSQASLINLVTQKPQNQEALERITAKRNVSMTWKPWEKPRAMLRALPEVDPCYKDFSGDSVIVGEPRLDGDPLRRQVQDLAEELKPWKKGPFQLFGMDIDAEWRSERKWERLLPRLPDLEGKRILDIGCNNGYYLFRMLAHNPDLVLGIDPFQRPFLQFQIIQHFLREKRLGFQMWGWEEVGLMDPVFDVIFCMGIIYHHRNPIEVLNHVHSALKPGGVAIVETIVTPGEDSVCLFPEDRYACMRNVWFVPTLKATENFLLRTRFVEVECISNVLHLPEEQRTTPWNPAPSYSDFLLPQDASLTIEGYPAPQRAIFLGHKKGGPD